MPLQESEQEILFTTGMNSKEHAELQDVSSMRRVLNLRFDQLGRLIKRPTYAVNATEFTSGSYYSSHAMEACFTRQTEACVVTNHKGVQRYAGTSALAPTYALDTASGSPGRALRYAPKVCTVARRFIASAQFGVGDQAILDCTSAVYNGAVLVVAWLTVSGSSLIALNAKAVDLTTGVTLHEVRQADVAADLSQGAGQVTACEYTEVGKEGVVVAYAYGTSAPFTAVYIRYDDATRAFVAGGTLTTNAKSLSCALVKNGTGILFAFTDNTSTFIKVQTRTVTTVASTYNSTKANAYAPSLVVGSTNIWLVSVDATHVYAEFVNVPGGASIVTVETWSGGAIPVLTAAALDTRSGQTDSITMWVGGYDPTFISLGSLGALKGFFTRVGYGWASGSTVQSALSVTEPHTTPLTSGFSVGGRAYCGMWATAEVIGEVSSVLIANFDYDTGRSNVVARMGHDRTALIPIASREVSVYGNTAYVPLLGDLSPYVITSGLFKYPQSVFVGELDFTARPLPSLELDGVALVASGTMFEYDGAMTYETQHFARPLVYVDGTSGTGQTGTFGFLAIYTWVDAQGRLHRSAPSAVVTSAVSNKQLDVYVSIPPFTAYSYGSRELDIELYSTLAGGSTYYLCSSSSKRDLYDTTAGAYVPIWYQFTAVVPSSASAISPYTTGAGGEELTSDPPPSFCSIARVGDRIWGIDAEDRARLWFSKPLVAGYAAEWNTVNTAYIGDQGVAVVDVNGTPTVLGKHGIWQIYGDGPNELGVGSFAPARRLPHEVECLFPVGVCKTPDGVMFRGRRGVYLLDVGLGLQPIGLPLDPSMRLGTDSSSDFARLVYDERHNEVRVIDSATGYWVYNTVEKKWVEWNQSASKQSAIDACMVAGRLWYVHAGANGSYRFRREYGVDESGQNLGTDTWVIVTPWVKLDGVVGFVRLWRMLFTLMLNADVGNLTALTVTMAVNYVDTTVDTFTWSGADLSAVLGAGTSVLTRLKMHPAQQRVSSFKLTITEDPFGAYAGSVPLSLRLKYGVRPGGSKGVKSSEQKGAT